MYVLVSGKHNRNGSASCDSCLIVNKHVRTHLLRREACFRTGRITEEQIAKKVKILNEKYKSHHITVM